MPWTLLSPQSSSEIVGGSQKKTKKFDRFCIMMDRLFKVKQIFGCGILKLIFHFLFFYQISCKIIKAFTNQKGKIFITKDLNFGDSVPSELINGVFCFGAPSFWIRIHKRFAKENEFLNITRKG